MRKEYTTSLYKSLAGACDSENRNWLQRTWDNVITDNMAKFAKWFIGLFQSEESKNKEILDQDAKDIMASIIEYSDVTEKALKQVFIDEQSLHDTTSADFKGRTDALSTITVCIACLRDIIDPNEGPLTLERIREGFFDKDEEYYYIDILENVVVDASGSRYEYSNEDIKKFTSNANNFNYFFPLNNLRIQYINDIGGFDAFNIAFFNFFQFIGDEVKSMILGMTDSERRKYLLKLYQADKIKGELIDTIDKMCESQNGYDDSDIEEAISTGKDFVDWVKKGGKVFGELKDYDKRTKKYKKYQEFMDKVGGVANFLSIIDDYGDAFFYLFEDYDKNLEMIESVKQSLKDGGSYTDEFKLALDQIEKEYQSGFARALAEAKDQTYDEIKKYGKKGIEEYIKKHGSKEWKKLLKKAASVEKALGWADKAINFVGDITGLNPESKARINALALNEAVNGIQTAYINSFNKIKGMNPEDEGYETAKKNLENNFNLLKNTYRDLFQEMANSESSEAKRAYYNFVSKEVSMATMKDPNLNIISYDEYNARYGS